MQSNPFGDAKPVDAEAKLRELEERIQKRKVSCSFTPGATVHTVWPHLDCAICY